MTERLKGTAASLAAGLVVLMLLTAMIYRDVRALTRETRERAEAAQVRWSAHRAEDRRKDDALHGELVQQLNTLAAELRAQRMDLARLKRLHPIEAMHDRAKEAPK